MPMSPMTPKDKVQSPKRTAVRISLTCIRDDHRIHITFVSHKNNFAHGVMVGVETETFFDNLPSALDVSKSSDTKSAAIWDPPN